MVAITIKNLPAEVHERLKLLAARNRRSLENEIIFCLTCYVERAVAIKEELPAKATKMPEVDHGLVDGMKRDGRV